MKYVLYLLLFIPLFSIRAKGSDNSFLESTFLKGFDFKTKHSSFGFDMELSYKGEVWNVERSSQSSLLTYVDNFDIIFGLDLEETIGLKGGALNLYIIGNNGYEPNEHVGSVHGISNIAAPRAWKIYTIHYEQMLLDDKLSFLIGMYDYNSEFDSKQTSGLFINPAQGIGTDISQSGVNGPSIFPTASFGLRMTIHPLNDIYLHIAGLDGIPGAPDDEYDAGIILKHDDGLFFSVETGINKSVTEGEHIKVGVGYWHYTGRMNHIISGIRNSGVYTFIDKSLYSGKNKNISAYLRLGAADHSINEIGFFVSGGLVYSGLIPGRVNDQIGIAFASGRISEENKSCFNSNLELTYLAQIVDYLFLQPNIQYFACPHYLNSANSHIVAGIRMGVSFL